MNSKSMSLGVSLALAVSCAASAQLVATSPSSSATPYVRAAAGGPAVDVVSFLTVGDSVNMRADGVTPYRFAGIPDGMGAYDNGNGTMTLFVNHEHTSAANGVNHAHQAPGVVGGSYVSRWIVNTSAGADFLRVSNGDDLMTSVAVTTAGAGSLTNFNRFCSADLALQSAFYNPASGKGTTEKIFMTGEESGSNGRVIAIGAIERKGCEIPAFNASQGAWETACARPYASDSTVVIATSDGGANRVFIYVGTKQDSGTLMERAGLMNGLAYGIQVQVKGANVTSENRDFCFNSSGSARYSASFVLAPGGTAAGTSFLRPEDGAWDPANPSDFYFVTTDRIDNLEIGGVQIGRSRLFRMRFSDIANPLAGGTIEALLGSTEGQNMADNMCVFNDITGGTRVMIQEDSGNAIHNAKTWLYTVATDSLQMVLESDKARFGDIGGVAPVAPFNQDEENSGVIDARDTLGLGWFIANMQAHYSQPGELVEGGQLYAFYVPSAVGSCMSDLSSPLDGQVSGDDLAILLSNWSSSGRSDINRDGTTDASDLGLLLNSWGSCGQ